MKKVFHFVSTNILSGLENVVINICNLVKGYDFTYVSPDGPINKYLNKYRIRHISINKITPMNVRKIIKRYKPNIVQGHDVKASLSLAMNSHLCHKRGIKIISELHSDDPRMWRLSLRSILYLFSMPFYDKIVVISKAIKNHFIFKKYAKDKIKVINNVVNINRIPHEDNKFDKRWDCIFLGRLVDLKNPIEFVNIIHKLKAYNKHITAIMVGEGPLYHKLIYIIDKLQLNNNVKLLGFKNNPYKYLKESKVCVVPSKFEGFGLVALESLLMGTPVIASPTGGLVNIVNNSCGGFASNSLQFSHKINELLNNSKLYEKKSLLASKHANELNDVNKCISEYKDIYK